MPTTRTAESLGQTAVNQVTEAEFFEHVRTTESNIVDGYVKLVHAGNVTC